MHEPSIDLCLFGIEISLDHTEIGPLLRHLPQKKRLGQDSWLIYLDRTNLPGLRKMYAAGLTFTPAAIDALRALSAPRTAAARVEITPQVCASARGLAATLDPSSAGGTGAGNPGEATARSSSPETKVAPG